MLADLYAHKRMRNEHSNVQRGEEKSVISQMYFVYIAQDTDLWTEMW